MGQLSAFALNVRNTISRQATVYVRRNAVHAVPVVGTGVDSDRLEFTGDVSDYFAGSVGARNLTEGVDYTIDSVTYDTNSNRTFVYVTNDLTEGKQGDLISSLTFYNLGTVDNVSVEWDVISLETGTDGRTRELGIDLTVNVRLKQTSDTELVNISQLTDYLLDVVISQDIRFGTLNGVNDDNWANTIAKNGFYVKGALVNVSGTLNFSGEESFIGLSIPMRIDANMIQNKPISLV